MSDLVFCDECKYLDHGYHNHENWLFPCLHPNNLTEKHNWMRRWFVHRRSANRINRKNECPWFSRKEPDDD